MHTVQPTTRKQHQARGLYDVIGVDNTVQPKSNRFLDPMDFAHGGAGPRAAEFPDLIGSAYELTKRLTGVSVRRVNQKATGSVPLSHGFGTRTTQTTTNPSRSGGVCTRAAVANASNCLGMIPSTPEALLLPTMGSSLESTATESTERTKRC